MILSYREPWTEQPPQFDAVIDLSNPLVPGLVFDLGPPSTLNFFNTVDGKKATRSPGVSLSPQKYGSGHTVTAANDKCIDFSTYPILTTFPYSILVVTDAKNEAVRQWVFSTRRMSGFTEMVSLGLNATRDGSGSVATAGSLFLYTVDNTGSFSCPTTGAAGAVQDGVHHYGATCDASGNVSYYVDGKLYGTNTQVNNNSTFHAGQETRVGAFTSTTNSATNTRSQLITRVWNGRLLAEADFKAQFDNPFGIYRPKRKILWFGAGGGSVSLTGSAAAQASASGTISVQVPIVGAATVVATASGTLTTQSPLDGSAAVVATATGELSVTFALSGAALVNALAAGAISTSVALSGSALANALATGNLLAGGAGALAGNAAAQASASGSLSTAIPLQGAASALAVATGGLTTAFPLVGVAAAVSHVTGDLTVTFGGALSGNAVAQVLAAGALSIQVALSGSAVAHALATGILGSGDVPNTPQDTWDRALQALFEPFYGDFGEPAVVAGIPVVGMFSSRAQDSFGIVQPSAAVLRMSATHVAAVGDTVTVGARTYQIAAIHDLDGSGTEKTLELK